MKKKHLIRQPTSGCHLPPLGKASGNAAFAAPSKPDDGGELPFPE